MAEPIARYPLAWPTGWKRVPSYGRHRAKFSKQSRTWVAANNPSGGYWNRRSGALSVSGATSRLAGELERLGVGSQDWLVSSNLKTRLDGLPYSNAPEPTDPGVAVYFKLGKKDRCLACDAWDRVADNIAAIAAHIECLRGIDRYGVGTLDQAFAGYAALPPTGADWWLVLGVDIGASLDAVRDAYRQKARTCHPDVGGSHAEMSRVNEAWAAAQKVFGV